MSTSTLNLKKITVTKEDGSTEVVYVPQEALSQKFNWRDHLPIIYTGVGIIVLLFSGYFTLLQIEKMKQNG